MTIRSLLFATALLAATAAPASAQDPDDTIAVPALRANVTVTGEVVRIGDVIDNAGTAAQIAIYRAPDLGTTGSLPVAQVLAALRNAAIGLLRVHGETNIAAAGRRLAAQPHAALALLGILPDN